MLIFSFDPFYLKVEEERYTVTGVCIDTSSKAGIILHTRGCIGATVQESTLGKKTSILFVKDSNTAFSIDIEGSKARVLYGAPIDKRTPVKQDYDAIVDLTVDLLLFKRFNVREELIITSSGMYSVEVHYVCGNQILGVRNKEFNTPEEVMQYVMDNTSFDSFTVIDSVMKLGVYRGASFLKNY